jgi:anthranilate phosphoribosyltransferase
VPELGRAPTQEGQQGTRTGGGPEENAARLRNILAGNGERPENDIIALNAGALLLTAGKAATLRDGAAMSRDALLAGQAGAVLSAYIEASNG